MIIEWLYVICLTGALLSSILLTGISWLHGITLAARWFTCLLLVATFTVASYLFFSISEQESTAFFWVRMRMHGLSVAPVILLAFALAYTGGRRWLRPHLIAAFMGIPVVTGIVIWFMPEYFWRHWEVTSPYILNLEAPTYTGWFFVHTLYTYALLVTTLVLFIRYALAAPNKTRTQVGGILLGSGIPVVIVTLPTVGLTQGLPNPFPLSLTVLVVVGYYVLYRQGLLKLSPLAYRTIIEHMTDAVVVVDKAQQQVLTNERARQMLATRDDLIQALLSNETDDWQATFEFEVTFKQSPQTFEVHTSPIPNAAGMPEYKLCVLRDITERKRAEQHAVELALEKERVRLLTRFIQDTAHEFKTPLTSINTGLYLITRSDDGERRKRKAREVENYVQRMQDLVDKLLLMVKLEGEPVLASRQVNMQMLISMACERAQARDFNGPELMVELQPLLPSIYGNAGHLSTMLDELLQNAYRFTPAEGRITIRACVTETWLVLELQDTGEGMPPEVLPHIFESFWRRDEAHSTPGFGLGLTIVQKIVERHQGQIEVESNIGQGTCFRVMLPLQSPECAKAGIDIHMMNG